MHYSFTNLLAWIFAALAVCGLGYQFLVAAGIGKFLRIVGRAQARHPSPSLPGSPSAPISILKPLRGTDPRMYEAFRSHCLQDYPEFEIIFGVSDARDPAVAEVERLRREFPALSIELVVCPEVLGTNRKVSALIQMLPSARHDLLLINDSDILVPPNYLRHIAGAFEDVPTSGLPTTRKVAVGMVTALYRATAGATMASRLEALTISTDFAGGVLSAFALEGKLSFGLGSTLAMRRSALDTIGGLQPLLDYLADDYELGNRIARAGLRVVLAPVAVETALPNSTFGEMFEHQLRWARTIRDRRLGGYVGLGITYALPWALLAALCAGLAAWSLALVLTVAIARLAIAAALCREVLDDHLGASRLWLLPLRDSVALLVWMMSFTGNTVVWRGERFRLSGGKLEKLEPGTK